MVSRYISYSSALKVLLALFTIHVSHALVTPSSLPGTWVSQGCYIDVGRTLISGGYDDAVGMTDESCIAYCSKYGYIYAGTEYTDQCYCGNTLAAGSGPATATDCYMPCAGNSSEACGGPDRLNLFWSGTTGPETNPGSGLWNFIGCYSEGTSGRTLPNEVTVPGGAANMSVDLCTAACQAAGYPLAGVEYSQECWCGNAFENGGALAPNGLAGCDMLCSGNFSEFCGGSNLLDVYDYNHLVSAPPWSSTAIPLAMVGPTSTITPSVTTSSSLSSTAHSSTSSSTTSKASSSSSSSTTSKISSSASTSTRATSSTSTSTRATSSSISSTTSKFSSSITSSTTSRISSSTSSSTSSKSSSSISSSATSKVSSSTSSSTKVSSSSSSSTTSGVSRSTSSSSKASSSSSSSTSSKVSSSISSSTTSRISGSTSSSTTSRVSSSSSSSTTLKTSSSSSSSTTSRVSSSTLSSTKYSSSLPSSTTSKVSSSTSSSSTLKTSSYSLSSTSSTAKSSTSTTPSTSSMQHSSPISSTASTRTTSSSTSTTTVQTLGIVPTIGPYIYQGCYTEATSERALSEASFYNYTAMTLQDCQVDCLGYTYFGVEYGGECYCGNTINSGSILATDQSDCSFICPGNPYEYCGAGDRLDMYALNGTLPTSSTSSATVAISTPTATGLPSGWAYYGCYVDGVNGRILDYQQADSTTNTIASCVEQCISLGYTIAGVEYSVQCFCDDYIENGGVLATDQSDCNDPCSGNTAEMCGGGNRISMYSHGTPSVLLPPATQTSDLPTNWTYSGCLQDNVNNVRTFPYEIINMDNNTATACLEQCQEFGYNAAGLEYGIQCFCGDVANIATAGVTTASNTNCQIPCSGNSSYLCGGENYLSWYSYDGPPLYTWTFKTGIEAGEYSLLIGGVCIPLMTAQVRTGKVTFVEKWGTGEANSTGAYELDLSAIDNFTLAWKTMHVQTDVFCSAGVILPDAAGRQLNIGGWSGSSTYGVRLYTPDGGPGVQGTNDWEENVNEVHLQTSRWYPTAMTMANGSILIIGGEVGSNSAPSPTLEILPPNGFGMVYLDFLYRTDPNNLYPFLCVLPSGGIFIQYYNEALIMDPITFQTVKQLPDVPGAVNDFLGGRNYPLEGTMILLPQYAPYTEPLTVLICGGSTPGPENALDNCVSTQPEVAKPVWTIERMPSRRVMTCMAPLPDGTILILNGAQHGVAGFGLADDPNLNAILYDPSQPVNARISIMANTTVARLYHSEAILLADGRVMVSGSDPQDGVHPEEYRVEVFTPPYLLSGLPQPNFTVENIDWGYNEAITFTVTSGSTASLRVSLLGLVVSTHGNSMGQRTFFPEVSCTGNNCTLITPLNANVCPPAWFQMFVLDGPTPSVAQFVRIGGDPAGIGNWPDYPDFTTPGLGKATAIQSADTWTP